MLCWVGSVWLVFSLRFVVSLDFLRVSVESSFFFLISGLPFFGPNFGIPFRGPPVFFFRLYRVRLSVNFFMADFRLYFSFPLLA